MHAINRGEDPLDISLLLPSCLGYSVLKNGFALVVVIDILSGGDVLAECRWDMVGGVLWKA